MLTQMLLQPRSVSQLWLLISWAGPSNLELNWRKCFFGLLQLMDSATFRLWKDVKLANYSINQASQAHSTSPPRFVFHSSHLISTQTNLKWDQFGGTSKSLTLKSLVLQLAKLHIDYAQARISICSHIASLGCITSLSTAVEYWT